MKRYPICVGMLCVATTAQAGDLNPPGGAVAPTMKTLDQVEPRIPINATNTPGDADSVYKITAIGSYYLTGNVFGAADKMGIEIAASFVTIDLMGYVVSGLVFPSGRSLDGIKVTQFGAAGIEIRNGAIASWGGDGVDVSLVKGARLDNLRVISNLSSGIRAGETTVITGCVASANGGDGISTFSGCEIRSCSASSNGATGIVVGPVTSVSGCSVTSNSNNGMTSSFGAVITDCSASVNGGDGFSIGIGSTINGCSATFNTGDGIQTSGRGLVRGNGCNDNGFSGDGAGIHVIGSDNRIEGNLVAVNDRGIDVDSTGNLIISNSSSGNSANYSIVAGNSVGQILNVVSATITSGNPWTNFSF